MLPLSSASVPNIIAAANSSGSSFPRHNQSQDNHVLHETLNVIDEHIDDLRSRPGNGSSSRIINDSGSEYSSHLDHRLSYIQGEETDEEEEASHTRLEVEAWTSDQVAEYLFTEGVEKHHCEVFRDQEITGEVLLGMDQTSIFIKAFDLGSVGRRLKTWQKIKNLQDEVNGLGGRRQSHSEAGSDGARRARSRNNTITGSISKLSPIDDRPLSQQKRRSIVSTPKLEPAVIPGSPISPGRGLHDSPSRPTHDKRPSAASVRELAHSRRHSSTDFRLTSTAVNNVASSTPKLISSGTFPQADGSHKKQPSFDKNWTLGGALTRPSSGSRPLSGSGFLLPDTELQDSAVDLDRGYFSSAEGGSKSRNVLKKRDSVTSHSRNQSYTDEQRMRSATAMARHSRYGSFSSSRAEPLSPAAQKYYGVASAGNHRRTLSTNTTESLRPAVPSKDTPPTVTKLGELTIDPLQPSPSVPVSPAQRQNVQSDVIKGPIKVPGLRAISDTVTGLGGGKMAPVIDSPLRDSPMQSPSRTGSSTPSMGPSFEMDSPDTAKSPNTLGTTGSRSSKKKSKKDTSAYTRGLSKISPREAMIDADYSGWMKKKSNTLMTTWKPRLFVLKGRRLAYYYSEDDEQEKGLIDISFHRVLPADNEKLTGLHATLTGASNTPTMPANTTVPTIADAEAKADPTASSDSIFIFKLVPPRAGLSRAVNFTKPTVHYFAVPNIKIGRAWMAALMKATIDRDDTQPIVTSYQQKTISLAKARAMRHRPPALMNLDEKVEGDEEKGDGKDSTRGGLGIFNGNGEDSAVSGLEKLGLSQIDSNRSHSNYSFTENGTVSAAHLPQSA